MTLCSILKVVETDWYAYQMGYGSIMGHIFTGHQQKNVKKGKKKVNLAKIFKISMFKKWPPVPF